MQEDVQDTHNNNDEELDDWLERPSIRAWVDREDIQRTRPPAFHSQERRALLVSIKHDEHDLAQAFERLKIQNEARTDNILTRAALDRMKESLTQKRVRCSPIQLLPPHLLIPIFLLIFPGGIPFCPHCRPSHRIFQVCHEWRTLAFSIPELWSTIRIPDSRTHAHITSSTLLEHSLLTWLERTRSMPLTIDIPFLVSYPCNINCWEILLTHIERWKSLRFSFYDFQISPISFICQMLYSVWELSDKCTLLDNLEINLLNNHDPEGLYAYAPDPFPPARFPHLRKVTLHFKATSLMSKISGPSITTLDYFYAIVTGTDSDLIVKNLPNLQSAHFNYCHIVDSDEGESGFPPPVFKHDNLRECQILSLLPIQNFDFLAQCPRLNLIALYNSMDMRAHNLTAPKIFSSHLRHLHLAAPFELSTEETMEFLDRFPGLYSLRLFQRSIYVQEAPYYSAFSSDEEKEKDKQNTIPEILRALHVPYDIRKDTFGHPKCPDLRLLTLTQLHVEIRELLYLVFGRQRWMALAERTWPTTFTPVFRVSMDGCGELPDVDNFDCLELREVLGPFITDVDRISELDMEFGLDLVAEMNLDLGFGVK